MLNNKELIHSIDLQFNAMLLIVFKVDVLNIFVILLFRCSGAKNPLTELN